MPEIRIEGKRISDPTGDLFGHAYLVYVDDDGTELAIRAGPDQENPISIGGGLFGNITASVNVALADTLDARPIADRALHGSTIIDLQGRDPAEVWAEMVQHAHQIHEAHIPYDLITFGGTGYDSNSNSFVASVLYGVGIDFDSYASVLPQYAYPGNDNLLKANYVISITNTIASVIGRGNGFDGNDIIVGAEFNDVIVGGRGDDVLVGGRGDDIIIGGGFGSVAHPDNNTNVNNSPLKDHDVVYYQINNIAGVSFSPNKGVSLEIGNFENSFNNLEGDTRTQVIVTDDGYGGSDRIVGVEMIYLTGKSDSLKITDLGEIGSWTASPLRDLTIDFGTAGEPAFEDDSIDLSNAGKSITGLFGGVIKYGVRVDLRDTSHQTIQYLSNSAVTTSTGGYLTGFYAGLLGRSDLKLTTANANSVTGTDYNDVLIGNAGKQADGEGYSTLHGGDGNDFLAGRGWESHLYGDSGRDEFSIGSNTWIEDGEYVDTADWGIRLYGGVKQWWMEGNNAYWAPFSSISAAFPVIGSELITTAAMFIDQVTMKFARYQLDADGTLEINLWGQTASAAIKNYSVDLDSGVGTAGITVFATEQGGNGASTSVGPIQSRLRQFLNLALKAGFGVGLYSFDPLVLDLDGDGFNLTSEANSKAYFEFDDDGFAEHTGWLRGTDGFLVRDANGNGRIEDITEMFGNASTGGFDMLAGYDSNGDGIISAADVSFAQIQVWQDADQDGLTDAGELKSLAALGIVSISLTHAAPAEPTLIGGNAISQIGNFTRADGTIGQVADVALQINEAESEWRGDSSVDAVSASLPQLSGSGELRDLRVAMTVDLSLKASVSAFAAMATNDLPALQAAAEAILYRWAGVEGVPATAIGSDGFDARKLAFIEKYSGYQLMPRDAGGSVLLDNIEETEALWKDQLERLTLRLVVQGPLADIFTGITYRSDLDLLVAVGSNSLADVFRNVIDALPADPTDAAAAWAEWAPLLGAVADGMIRSDANVVRGDFVFAQLVRALEGMAIPLSLATMAEALGVADLRIGGGTDDILSRGTAEGAAIYFGGGGADALTGGSGQDVYVFGHAIGDVTINDIEARPAGDRIRFAFLNQGDVVLVRDGVDLLITVTATGETVRVTGQFANVVPLGSDLLLSSDKGVEDIQFADGSIMEIPEIMAAVGTGTDGDDHLIGTMHSDVFTAGKGNDLVEGGDDADLYVFNRGDGNDIYSDRQTTVLLRAADLLVFGDDIAPEDLVYARSGGAGQDLLITVGNGGGTILIQDQFSYTSLGYNAALAPNSRVEVFAFRNFGDSFSHRDLQQQLIAESITDGDDLTRGFGDDDTFAASSGDDILIGMDGADTYAWSVGSGNDTIREQAQYIDINVGLGGISLTVRADVVQFDESISPSTLVFARDYDTDDLAITNTATGETLTVDGQFNSFQTGVLGAQWFDRVEWFAFADNSAYSWQDIEAIVTAGSLGNDRLRGDILADHMVGGTGDDLLSGGGGGDTYVFNAGDGHDTIFDDNRTLIGDGFLTVDQTIDTIELGAGIDPGDVSLSREGSSITLTFQSSGDVITLQGQDDYIQTGVFGAIPTSRIEQVKFHDGTIWAWQDINRKMIAAQTTAGNDVTQGFTLEDRFEKSAGDDILSGGDSADTYVFGTGAGHDRIRENVTNVLYGDGDIVEFDATVAPADVNVSRDGNDLVLTLTSGDTLRVEGEFAFQTMYSWTDVELFKFADGTSWTKEDVQHRLLQSTAGDDHLVGFHLEDDLDGGAGNDVLEGADGSDTYHFDRGYGDDAIHESVTQANLADFDVLAFGPTLLPEDLGVARDGDDLVLTILDSGEQMRIVAQFGFANWFAWNDIELFTFANGASWTDLDVAARLTGGTAGDDHILGTFRSDTLDGKAGNDILEGGDGSDIYLFGYGDGQDEIREGLSNANLSEDDELRFGAGITLQDLGFTRDGNDLIITLAGSSDSVRLKAEFNHSSWFSWNDVERFTFADGSFITRDYIQQTLLTGTAGDDHLIGFFDVNTLDGGAGDDLLEGGDGADTYVFGRGYGHDYVRETKTDGNLSDDDTVSLAAGITPDDVTLIRDGYDLIIQLDTGDTLTVENHFTVGYNEPLTFLDIDRIRFASGEEWTKDDILLKVLQGTSGNDILIGAAQTDLLDGGAGDDWLQGEEGSDQYVWGVGYGNDTIQERYTLVTRPEFDELTLHGVAPANLKVSRDGLDVILTAPTGETLTINGQLADLGWTDIEQINFDDGSTWSQDDIRAQLLLQAVTPGDDVIEGFYWDDLMLGGAGNDTLYGAEGNDVFAGGTGDDRLLGDTGNDIYRFGIGDGHDTIEDQRPGWDTGLDTVEFGAGIAPDGVVVSRDGDDLLLTLPTGDSVRLYRGAREVGVVSLEIEQVRFADGTIWTSAMVRAMAMTITSGDDHIDGSNGGETIATLAGNDYVIARAGNDVLIGGTGDDTLCGDGGNDIYRYALGDGDDFINDNIEGGGGDHGFDTLELAADIDPSMVNITGVGNDYRITFAGQAGSLLLVGAKVQNSSGIERIVFANGTVWNYAEMAGRSLGATEGNDTISGTNLADVIGGLGGNDYIEGGAGNDILAGGTGNDSVYGGTGDDIYRFNLGDGQDLISEFNQNGNDRLELGEGIDPANIQVTQANNGYDFVLSIAGTTDKVTISNGNGWNAAYRVEQVRFADGTNWSIDDLLAHMPTAAGDAIRGSIEANVIGGGAGDDWIRGDGGNDTLTGGLGNDYISGGGGDDVYLFNLGDGQDTIAEIDESGSGVDRLQFGAGISAADVQVSQADDGYDFVLKIAGTTDQVTINHGNAWYWESRVDEVRFADGTSWGINDLLARVATPNGDWIRGNYEANTLSGGGGDDWIRGDAGNDTLSGGAGNDSVYGGPNDDVYLFNLGDGQDTISEYGESGWGYDKLIFGSGIAASDVQVTMENGNQNIVLSIVGTTDRVTMLMANAWSADFRIEEVRFADGTIWSFSDLLGRVGAGGSSLMGSDSYMNGDLASFGGVAGSRLARLQGPARDKTAKRMQIAESLDGWAGDELSNTSRTGSTVLTSVPQYASRLIEQIAAIDWKDGGEFETPALFRKQALFDGWTGGDVLSARHDEI
jgi:Ca2+-binding RTX toxin-like protein